MKLQKTLYTARCQNWVIMTTVKIFISSVMNAEGTQFREATIRAVEDLKNFAPVYFETFPAHPAGPGRISLEEVKDADIFIQVMCYETTDIVAKEYDQAFKNIPDRILIFIKDGPLSESSEQHKAKIQQRHTYKTFSSSSELAEEVETAVTTLATYLLKKKGESISNSETLIDERITLFPGKDMTYRTSLFRGDQINGIINGNDTFDVYFFSEAEYAQYLDEEDFEPDAEDVKAYNLDFKIKNDGTYYIVILVRSTLIPLIGRSLFGTVISVEIRRSSNRKR